MKERISKFLSITKKYGTVTALKKITAYVKANYIDKFDLISSKHKNDITHILDLAFLETFDRIIIRRSHFGYDVPLFQRPQHLAKAMAENNCLVFYEVTTLTDKVRYITKVTPGLYLVNMTNIFVHRMLMKYIEKSSCPKYIEVYSTDWKLTKKQLLRYKKKGFSIIYQYIDHISPALCGTKTLPKPIKEKYRLAMSDPDIFVIATADKLYSDIAKHRSTERLVLSQNGVDTEYFKNYNVQVKDELFEKILGMGRPVICYYGALASWVDYELLYKIDRLGKYSIVLIGIKYDTSFKNTKEFENTYFLGQRDYKVLKYYAKSCDILIIPFIINDITRATNPVKLFEYMAVGRPIVCTDMDECKKYESPLIGKDHRDFISKLEAALNLRNNDDYKQLLEKEAAANDWSIRAKEIICLLREWE